MPVKLFIRYLLLAGFIVTTVSCRRNVEVPSQPAVSFNNDIRVIISGNCAQSGCHGDVNTNRFSLLSYDKLMGSGIVSAGDAHKSGIYNAITGRSDIMPPSPQSPLTDRQILLIYVWIEQGAKNN